MSSGPNHDIRPIDRYIEGDSLRMLFTAKDLDSDLVVKNLTGSDISWELHPRSQHFPAELTLDDSGVDLNISDADEGEFEIEIAKEATEQFRGKNVQVIEIVDDNDKKSTVTGQLKIIGIGPEQ